MIDVTISANASFEFALGDNRFLAAMTVEGSGAWDPDGGPLPINRQDFSVIENRDSITVTAGEAGLRLVAVNGPRHVNYALYGR